MPSSIQSWTGGGPKSAEERSRAAGSILTESAGYPQRQQLLMIAPGLEDETDRLFDTVRRLRFLLAEDPLRDEQEWENAVAAVTEEMDVLREAMRRDLSNTFKYATKTTLPGKKRGEIARRTAQDERHPVVAVERSQIHDAGY